MATMCGCEQAQSTASSPDVKIPRRPLGKDADGKSQLDSKAPGGTTPARPSSVRPVAEGSRFGLAFKTSTLGLGADLGVRIVRSINLRVGFGTFHYTADLRRDDTAYQGSLHFRSVQAVVDCFPFAGSFHVSPGVLFHNCNRLTAFASPPCRPHPSTCSGAHPSA